jgi:Asp-tRNA(Asn)/Glu-tRNA(Gln) amidotransferase A subunit family amidase
MTGEDLAFRDSLELAALVRTKEVSPVELVRLYLERIDRLDDRLRAYITVCRDDALAAARRAETAVLAGEPLGPLHGVPFAVKDQFDARGLVTTMGSQVLKDAAPAAADATVVARLRAAGAVLLGKLNLTEFALGGTREFPFGQPCNPWNPAHDPGGSSSGSGIATAAALCAFTLGEDTGGSVRSPAAWCGVVGVRPTWGRVSRHGVFPLSWSMDAAGPLSRSVKDSALILSIIAGRDAHDPTTSAREVPDYARALTGDLPRLRLGIVRELTSGPETHTEVRAAVEAAAAQLNALGVTVDEVSLPLLPMAGAAFMALADSEGAGLHARWLRERPGDYDAGTRRRLLAAGLLPAALYHRAQRARALVRQHVLAALGEHDALLAPMAHTAAPLIAAGRAPITSKADVGPRFFTRRSYGSPASLAGVPALSVPCGFTSAGLPIGLQVIGRRFEEATILRVAHAYEQATAWHRRRPPL